ncbi:hypothetical protein [Burkholderia pseudomallei]|uniref:hypothetical protein n=1 Tax=Burkholderia pseudomallei TaxID=28450 RepID=UPI001E5E7464|nr:hypothetical protein [Burkholderia pseudomallei]
MPSRFSSTREMREIQVRMLSNEHSGGAAVPRASTMPNAAPLRKRTSDTPRIRSRLRVDIAVSIRLGISFGSIGCDRVADAGHACSSRLFLALVSFMSIRIAYRAAARIPKLGRARRFGQTATQRFDAGARDVRHIVRGGRSRRSAGPASHAHGFTAPITPRMRIGAEAGLAREPPVPREPPAPASSPRRHHSPAAAAPRAPIASPAPAKPGRAVKPIPAIDTHAGTAAARNSNDDNHC